MKLLIVAIMFGLTGCGAKDRFIATYTGYQKVCVDGVTYLQFTSGSTAQLGIDGKPVACR